METNTNISQCEKNNHPFFFHSNTYPRSNPSNSLRNLHPATPMEELECRTIRTSCYYFPSRFSLSHTKKYPKHQLANRLLDLQLIHMQFPILSKLCFYQSLGLVPALTGKLRWQTAKHLCTP